MDEQQKLEQEGQEAAEQVMPPKKKPNRAPLVIFAVIVLLGLVGYGVYAWQNNRVAKLETQVADLKKTTPAPVAASKKADDPYAGWKSYTTKNEKLTFKYPSNYILKAEDSGKNQVSFPGMDTIHVTSPSGFVTVMQLGISGIGGACPDAKVVLADKVTITGRPMYINYINKGDGYVSSMLLSGSPEYACFGGFKSENVYADPEKTQEAANLVSSASDSYKEKSVTTYKTNADVKNAALIIQSFSY